jgi:hypothetical protein
MAESEADAGRSEIVDGQQRITTLDSFYRNNFRLLTDDRCPYFGEHSMHYAGKTFEELKEAWQSAFSNYVLNLVILPRGMTLDLRLEIFRRINEGGTPLSGQDIRLSYYSESEAVRFIQLAGIYNPERTGSQRMIRSAPQGMSWPWGTRRADEVETWCHWWEDTKTASGQSSSEMFLWFMLSYFRKQLDQVLNNRKHLNDNLRLRFRNRTEEVLDIACAQLRYEDSLKATASGVPRLLPTADSLATNVFPTFASWVATLRNQCVQQVPVSRNRSVALLIPALIEVFGEDCQATPDHHWGWIGKFVSRSRDTASQLGVDFPEPKGRWGGERGQRAQIESYYEVARAIQRR